MDFSTSKKLKPILLFSLIFTFVLGFSYPVYKVVNHMTQYVEEFINKKIKDSTGLRIEYKSLSPSILNGIHINELSVKTVENNFEIVRVKRLDLSYNLKSLIKRDYQHFFTKLAANSVDLKISLEELAFLLKTNLENAEDSAVKNENKEIEFSPELVKEIVQKYVFAIPFKVLINRLNFSFSNESIKLDYYIKQLALSKNNFNSSINLNLQSQVKANLVQLDNKSLGAKINLEGNLLSELDGSSFKIVFDEYSKADFSVRRLENLLRYSSNSVYIDSVQSLQPFNYSASFNFLSQDLKLSLKTKKLDPFNLVILPKLSDLIQNFRGSLFSIDTQFELNLLSKKINWYTNDSIQLSKKITPEGQMFYIDAEGNSDNINVKSIYGKGELTDFTLFGSYDIKKIQPYGILDLQKLVLPNKNSLSFELYIDPGDNGFVCYIPQLFLGSQSYSDFLLNVFDIKDSIDFTFDGYDYSHFDYDKNASVHIDGNYNFKNNQYLQAYVNVDSLFMDSIARTVTFFTTKDKDSVSENNFENFKPYLGTTEIYFSTDFKSVTFNSPFTFIANTKEDNQFLFISFDGSESSIQLSQLDLIFGSNSFIANAQADILTDEQQIIFDSSFSFNSIPYSLNGIYNFDNDLQISGDYDFSLLLDLKNKINGSLAFNSLPVEFGNFISSFTASLDFSFKDLQDFTFNILNFKFEELTQNFRTKPSLMLTGNVSPQGLVLDSIRYSDMISAYEGNSFVFVNLKDNLLESVNCSLSLVNSESQSSQKIVLDGNITNPFKASFGDENFIKDLYFSLTSEITSFPMSFFMAGQDTDNRFDVQLNVSGTIENPYVLLSVPSFSMMVGDFPLYANCSASLVEGKVSLDSLYTKFQSFEIKKTNLSFDLNSFNGDGLIELYAALGSKYIDLPVNLKFENLSSIYEEKGFPKAFSLTVNSDKYKTNLFSDTPEIMLSVLRSPGRFDIFTNELFSLSGEVLDKGTVNINVPKNKPLHFSLNGNIANNLIDLHLDDFYCDLSKFSSAINSEFIEINTALVEGEIELSGAMQDPGLDGNIFIRNMNFSVPLFIPETITSNELAVEVSHDEIVVHDTTFNVKDGRFSLGAYIGLDRWQLNSMNVNLISAKNKDVPIYVKIPFVTIKGKTSFDMNVSFDEGVMDLNGNLGLHHSEILLLTNLNSSMMDKSSDSKASENTGGANPIDVRLDLNLLVGQKVQIVMNPLLRGLSAPQTPISFSMDSASGLWSINSDIVMRGGEVSYLSRNFYLKEGRVILNETQDSFDPYITLRAETREHDSNGESVTISLQALRQRASSFKATLTSIPAKSENEIYSLLGQIATGDSQSVVDFLMGAVDYSVQMTLFRKLENALRDLMNFDIFSIRTTFLQNTLRQGFSINTEAENGSLFGNLFDNSTVYIGKYFGNTIYADAMMHWTYDENKIDQTYSGLVFQPEIGLELESPFANIRWSFSPQVDDFQSSWATASSLTLSWRISF